MKFNIPELGTKIVLAEDWHFPLHREGRNFTLFDVLGIEWRNYNWRDYRDVRNYAPPPIPATLPKGTALTVDRIYIRKGARDFSSVSFLIPKKKTTKKKVIRTATVIGGPEDGQQFHYEALEPGRTVRFWAKLADVNRMVLEDETEE